MKLGCSIAPWELNQFLEIAKNFDFWATKNYFRLGSYAKYSPSSFDLPSLQKARSFMKVANQYKKPVVGHNILWHDHGLFKNPAWVKDADLNTIKGCIQNFVSEFPEIVDWMVLNEPIANNGKPRHSIWYKKMGDRIFDLPFFWVREANPNAGLWINDYRPRNLGRWQFIARKTAELRKQGVPINGIGIQYNVNYFPEPLYEPLKAVIREIRHHNPDIRIALSEVSVDVNRERYRTRKLVNHIVPLQTRFRIQADIYERIWNIGKQEGCESFCVWGLLDKGQTNYLKKQDHPTLFDEKGQPKPAFWRIQEKRNHA